ncbi:MAG: cytochrome P450 [Ktedonobacteraceae bacterium]|jgi:cytochrome P450
MAQPEELNLNSPGFKANPYPAFAQLRSHDPVHQILMPGGRTAWLITRYEDADDILKDQRFVKDVRHALSPEELAQRFPWAQMQPQVQPVHNFLSHHMLNSDPPDHTRLRALVNISFTPRLVEQWRERIQAITNELLDAVQDKGEMDLIDEFAFPLPIIVITEMLGVPSEDRMNFRKWSNMVVEAAGNPEAFQQAREHLAAFREYLRKLIDEKRGHPSDDLLGKLIQAEAEGDKLSEDELIAMVFLLLIAGHETTVNLIGNGVLALLLHPDQIEKLKQTPPLIKTAIEEFLRYQGPLLTATQRWAREDVEIDGKLLRRGDSVLVVLASANRDPAEFAQPEELDITRPENRHLAFGKGIHYCLGAPLARLEGQIAIGTLIRRMPNLRLNADPQTLAWRPGILLLGLSKLPVTF